MTMHSSLMSRTLLALALALAPAAHAQEAYTIDPRHTFPSFEVLHHGFSIQRGRFNQTTGKVVLDRARQAGTVEIRIEAASIDTGLDELEKVLRGPGFFDVERHPLITFRASKLRFDGDRLAGADGELTLLGVTRPVSLEVSLWKCGLYPPNRKQACGAEAGTRIRRSEFGMTGSLPGVADEVRIAIQIEAFRD